jgi:hypothetical protein
MTWLIRTWLASRRDHDGLLPGASMGDNELITGHFVSYHLYAVAGARWGARLAEVAGQAALAGQWRAFAGAFGGAVMARLGRLVAETGGVITPGFEGYAAQPVTVNVSHVEKPYTYTPAGAYGQTGGCDWHNLGAAFPTEVLPPDHPWITSSLARWRHAYVEGAFPYPSKGEYRWIHNYNTLNLSGTWLRRGGYAEALRDLYGVLLHTSATHASAEVADTGGRLDFNCTPHNWFSAKLVRFIRDLLVHEGHDGRLRLLAGLSPAWMAPGMSVGLSKAPTESGEIGFEAVMREDGLDLDLDFVPRAPEADVVLCLPPFLEARTVTADGAAVAPVGQGWPIPAGARRVEARWVPRPLPDLSFERVASAYIEDYGRRAAALTDR